MRYYSGPGHVAFVLEVCFEVWGLRKGMLVFLELSEVRVGGELGSGLLVPFGLLTRGDLHPQARWEQS